ncbi:uncharacterized protein LOC144120188 [Amblyomma americanum]
MEYVINATSKDESPVSSISDLATGTEDYAGVVDEATPWLSEESFGEPAGWSSSNEPESVSTPPFSARKTPRIISAAPSLLALTRSLPSPGRLSPPSDDEQRMLPPLDEAESSRAMTSRQASAELYDLTGAHRLSVEPLPPRLSRLARCFLVAGAVLCLVSALLALVAWRLDSEPLGTDLAQNMSGLVPRHERLA